MKCMNCGLINPETAERCDCGYDFATQVVKASYLPAQQMLSRSRLIFLLTSPAIFIAIGPLVGLLSTFLIYPVVTEGISSITAHDLRLLIFMVPTAYAIGAIPAFFTGILYGMVSLIFPHKIIQNFLFRAMLGGIIGALSTDVYCQIAGLGMDLVLWAGLPAGALCSLLPKNWPPRPIAIADR